jgi:GAF domain-containing protein/anti-sigma regulatory factor (Ser/Thr protein kinase)
MSGDSSHLPFQSNEDKVMMQLPTPQLTKIFSSLSEIPLSMTDRSAALKRITELGKEAMNSHACTLIFVDIENNYFTQVACAGFDEEFERRINGRKIKLEPGDNWSYLDYALIMKGEGGERYNLQSSRNGVANPFTARKYSLNSVLSRPLKLNGRLIGYFNHFSNTLEPFTEQERDLLEVFARQAVLTIDRFEYHRAFERSFQILNSVSQHLLSMSEEEFLGHVSESARELLGAQICIVWKLDEKCGKLKIAATSGEVDDAYKKEELDPATISHIATRKVGYLRDVTQPNLKFYKHSDHARARGWTSLLTAPMWVQDRLIGVVDVYTKKVMYFKEWEKTFFATFANHAALAIQKAELLRDGQENLSGRQRLEKLNEVIREVSAAQEDNSLFELILQRSLELTGAGRGWVAKFNTNTGQLDIVAHVGDAWKLRALELGKGITGLALKQEAAIRADDVRDKAWRGVYENFWEDTRSELAIPIFINNAQIHVGDGVSTGSKSIGIINLESPQVAAFSQTDEDVLKSLASHSAIIFEKLEFDRKMAGLREIEREIAGSPDWDNTVDIVLRAITDILGFEFVNISLVDNELNRIRAQYVIGIPERDVDQFKKMADHTLDGNDIQASIMRSKLIEVPNPDDKRFDPYIYNRFLHHRLIRVFIPMIASQDKVIGTVEAGYARRYRKYIYERDVQILETFVDFAVRALEQRRRGLLPRISHEFNAPIAGIKNNVVYLQHSKSLDEGVIQWKLDDILTDCELLVLKVAELEHIFGGKSPVSKPELTFVYRDIIIKTVNQLKPLVAERGFEASRIKYDNWESRRIRMHVDKPKLSSVVYNLLINSIKYAENDASQFNVTIAVDETKHDFILKFKDWGIGIDKRYIEKVFDEGFRAPEAINSFVTGSGLGLTIARKAMRELGGELRLANRYKPTEFHVILPKSLKEAPYVANNPVRRR